MRENKQTTHSLLERFPVIHSSDFDEVRHKVGTVFCEHDLHIVGKSQHLDTSMHYRRIQHVGFGHMLYGASVDIDPGRLGNFFLLQFPLQGEETIVTNNRSLLSTPQMGSIISPTQGFRMRHSQRTQKLFLRIERQALENKYVQYYGRPLRGKLEFESGICLTKPAGRALKQLIDWQFFQASEGDLFERPLIASQLEETLMLSVLGSLPHNQVVAPQPAPALAPHFVHEAEAFMQEHAHLPLTAGEVATHVQVSLRTLFAGFKKFRNTSPMAYLRDVRLQKAHAELSSPSGPDITVTHVALRWGFTHLGQFSAAYRRRWGVLPSETLRRQS